MLGFFLDVPTAGEFAGGLSSAEPLRLQLASLPFFTSTLAVLGLKNLKNRQMNAFKEFSGTKGNLHLL